MLIRDMTRIGKRVELCQLRGEIVYTAYMADCVLRICTRERQYSKIATFTTDRSIAYLLDVLYSYMFVPPMGLLCACGMLKEICAAD